MISESLVSPDKETADLVQKHLVVEESALVEQTITRAKRFIMLTSNGEVHVRGKKTAWSQRGLIQIFLLGKRLAYLGGLTEAESATVEEISKFVGADPAVVSARGTELLQDGLVERLRRGEWRLSPLRVGETLDELEHVSEEP